MLPLYVDTSALVKFYYPEADSKKIEELILKAPRIIISNLSIVEMASALSKKVRTGELESHKESLVWNCFLDDLHANQVEMVAIDERHYSKAADLIRTFGKEYGIKTLDSLHLAIAHNLPGAVFLCSDKILTKLAKKIGIKTAPK